MTLPTVALGELVAATFAGLILCSEIRRADHRCFAFVATLAAALLTGCATALPPQEHEPAPEISGPWSARSLRGEHGAAMFHISGADTMSQERAGAALRPAAAEHVLWKPSSFSRPRSTVEVGSTAGGGASAFAEPHVDPELEAEKLK
jgi:hypothetical protein